MGLRVDWVAYGPGAYEALLAAVAAGKAGDPLAPVTVVVPSNHVGVAARRLLASGTLGPVCERGRGLAATTFVTPFRLAELLGAPALAAAGRRPVSTPVIAAAIRAALAEQPGLFKPVASHPATESALVASYRELRELSDSALDSVAKAGPRAADVVRIHRAARRQLESAWYDEQDLMVAAAERVTAGLVADVGAVIVHLPQQLSRHAALLLRAVAGAGDVVVIAGVTGQPRADADVLTAVAALGHTGPGPAGLPAGLAVSADRTRVVTTSDADDEVRAAVRAVVDAARGGTPLDRIAILHASPEPYARLVHEHLSAAGVPANGAAVVPLAARMAGRTLLDLLALPDNGFRRQDVFAWLSAAPILDGHRWVPATAWERYSRDAAVVSGRADWDDRLTELAAELDRRAANAEADPDAPAWRAERNRADAERVRHLRTFMLGVIDDLSAAAAQPRRWADHAAWARRRLDQLLGGPGRREGDGWPAAEVKAAERVERAIDRLAALDPVEGPVDLAVFTRTLQLELEDDLGRIGRFGQGVLVGSVGMGVGLDLDLIVVLGLAEGTFPAPSRDDSLLPDREREAAGGQLPLRQQRIERQHRELLAALAGAQRQFLTMPRGDLRRSSERVPSRWLLDMVSTLAGRPVWSDDLAVLDAAWLDHVPSFDGGLRRLRFPATAQEHRLRDLLARAPSGLPTAADPVLGRGMDAVTARKSDRFTRFDGNLAGLPVPSPADEVTSATRLERWAACPFDYFLRDVLHVDPVENPEEQLVMSPLDRGKLVHRVLEEFTLEVIARPKEEQPAPEQPWPAADRARLLEIGASVCDEYQRKGLTGRALFWGRDRQHILADLERFLDEDDTHRRQYRTRPVAAELAFGFGPAAADAVSLALPNGRVVRFRGKADRVDVDDAGALHIVDYKTGGTRGYTGFTQEEPDQQGRHLQLPVYGVAARQHVGDPDAAVVAEYWFVSSKGEFKRKPLNITGELLDQVGHTLQTIVDGIESGVFPAHPTAGSTTPFIECHSCDPDGLGVADLRARWDRKRLDPDLALYAELADPFEEVDV